MARHKPPNDGARAKTQPPKWEDVIKHLAWRDWPSIRRKWASLPNLSAGFGTNIEHGISELPSLPEICDVHDEHDCWYFDGDIPGLREGVLIESYMLLLKAINVVGGAQLHIDSGACSWSLSSGYHGAFFAAKSISGLLGASLVERGKSILVDVWTPPEQISIKKQRAGVVPMDRFLFVKWYKSRVDQEPIWKMFQRIVRVTDIEPRLWPESLVHFLKNSQSDSFGAQRNRLHYENHYWPYVDELVRYATRAEFGKRRTDPQFRDQIASLSETDDYPIALGFILCWMATVLFVDLADLVGGLSGNVKILEKALSQACHERFRDFRDRGLALLSADG